MGFIKKKLFWIICALVVIAAMSVFFYGSSVAKENQQSLDTITQKCKSVPGLAANAQRANRSIIEQLQANINQARADIDQVRNLSLQTSDRPFFYSAHNTIFPLLIDTEEAPFYYAAFGDAYVSLVDNYLQQMNAQDRPSPAEIQNAINLATNRGTQQPGTTTRPGGTPMVNPNAFPGAGPGAIPGIPTYQQPRDTGRRTSSQNQSQQEQRIVEQLRRTRADEISVYASPQLFCAYDYWKTHTISFDDTMLLNSWFTQVAAWIHEDVVTSIVEVNGDSESVSTSPVKRVIEISFCGDTAVPSEGPSIGSFRPERSSTGRQEDTMADRRVPERANSLPTYVVKDEQEDATIGDITNSFTQRTSNDLYDVVQFELAVIIETTAVTDFINTLQGPKSMEVEIDGQTTTISRSPITVLQMTIEPVNIEMENTAGYYYGSGSFTTLRLVCEYIFFTNKNAPREQQILYERSKPQPVLEIFDTEEDNSRRRR